MDNDIENDSLGAIMLCMIAIIAVLWYLFPLVAG